MMLRLCFLIASCLVHFGAFSMCHESSIEESDRSGRKLASKRLDANVRKLGLIGSFSGGHLLLHDAVKPHKPAHQTAV